MASNIINNGNTGTTFTDEVALLTEQFSQEILHHYNQSNKAKQLVSKKTIDRGYSSASFLLFQEDVSDTQVHSKGATVTDTELKVVKRAVSIERPIVKAYSLDDYESFISNYDERSLIASQTGTNLSRNMDKRLFKELVKASQTNGVLGNPSGFDILNPAIDNTNAKIRGNALKASLFKGAETFSDRNIPTSMLTFTTSFENFYALVQADDVVNADFVNNNGGIKEGVIYMIAGITIQASNNAFIGSVVKAVGGGTTTTEIEGLLTASSAVAYADILAMKTEVGRDIRKQEDIIVTKMAFGAGTLDPQFACVITS